MTMTAILCLNEASWERFRDSVLDELGFSAQRPVWLGLRTKGGQEVVTRVVSPPERVTPREVVWASRKVKLPRRLPGTPWYSLGGVEQLEIIVSATPAGAVMWAGSVHASGGDTVHLGFTAGVSS
jgi:hypothetical protein